MRALEIILAFLLAAHVLWPLVSRKTRPMVTSSILEVAVVVFFAHLLIDGYRWQMIPLYILTATLVLTFTLANKKADPANQTQRTPKVAASFLTFGLLALATALPALLPVPRIASPSGPYEVGTRSFVLTDASRKELYSGRDEPRKFMIQVWYPATPVEDDRRAPWMENAPIFAKALSGFLHQPDFFLDHLALAISPAYQNSPVNITDGPYPVIVFSHGWSGFAAQNTAQVVELASHGYVVIGMQHTYGAIVTVFPDGTVAPNNPDALPAGMPEPGYTDAARLLVDQWAHDMSFALDFMTGQNADAASPFSGALDLTRVGVFGHSTGGGATIQFCGTDPRCVAGLTEDAFMTPVSQEVQDSGVTQPFFFLFSQQWTDDLGSKNNTLFDNFYSHLPTPAPVVTILGTRHYDFSDLPLLTPLAPQLGFKGPINGKLVVKILNDYLVAYFDQQLKGIPSPIPFGPSAEYPDLRWENQ
jgi:predicted dienelactone hydrolase